ncbi:MAG: hypothetical protein WB988_26205 [Candidatus Nitrosopolaris sp.]
MSSLVKRWKENKEKEAEREYREQERDIQPAFRGPPYRTTSF